MSSSDVNAISTISEADQSGQIDPETLIRKRRRPNEDSIAAAPQPNSVTSQFRGVTAAAAKRNLFPDSSSSTGKEPAVNKTILDLQRFKKRMDLILNDGSELS